ncbi:MAG: hypothetical protein OXF06_08040 [Bacteroidetes bacterium]|nr:hypothetical protein [Bacteroidota bacterium]MCY4224774.1 hypothetical protein [Bacteroidota bacterium]
MVESRGGAVPLGYCGISIGFALVLSQAPISRFRRMVAELLLLPFNLSTSYLHRYLHHALRPLPTGATGVGWGLHPPQESAFPRRTATSI